MKRWKKFSLSLGGVGILSIACLSLSQPQWMFQLVSQLKPGALFFVDTDESVIALTIDDGPHGETTEKILQVLERHEVQATFFMLSDELSGHEVLLQKIVENGHELGNHMATDESSIRLPPTEFKA